MSSLLAFLAIGSAAMLVAALAALVAVAASRSGSESGRTAPHVPSSADHAPTSQPESAAPRRIRAHHRATVVIALGAAGAVVLALALWEQRASAAVAHAVGPFGPTGLVAALAPLTVALVHTAISCVGEATWPRPGGTVRQARLAPRSVRAASPAWPRSLVLVWSGLLVALLLATGALGDGTRLSWGARTSIGEVSASAGPFPGWPYGLPTLALLALLLLATASALVLITRRPAVLTLSAPDDLALRRRSSGRVLRLSQAAIGVTLAGNLAATGFAVHSVGTGWGENGIGGPWWGGTWPVFLVLAIAVVVTALAGLAPSVSRPRRAAPTVSESHA